MGVFFHLYINEKNFNIGVVAILLQIFIENIK